MQAVKRYALVTGASQGLGKFLAIECAREGFGLVLVALPESGLPSVQKYIARQFGVPVLIVETDLAREEHCYRLFRQVRNEGITISILINNAGCGGSFAFEAQEGPFYSRVVALNVTTPTLLCRLFLADLKRARPAYIMNISSLAALFNLPQKQVYGATKSYLLSFSQALGKELRSHDVQVSCLIPGGMNTHWRLTMENRLMQTRLSRWSVMEPSRVAAIAIAAMLAGKELIVPGFWNRCFIFWNRVFPRRMRDGLIRYQSRNWHSHGLSTKH